MHHAFDDDADAFANEARIGAAKIERLRDADCLKPPRHAIRNTPEIGEFHVGEGSFLRSGG
jgi:hypothetical protein